MEKMLKGLLTVLLASVLGACAMQPPKLSGDPLQPPKVQPTTIEIPVPPLPAGSVLKDALAGQALPENTASWDLIAVRITVHYWPDNPVVTVQPALITTRVPYHYHLVRDRLHCRWRWGGVFHSGLRCDWNNEADRDGLLTLGLDSKVGFTPGWNLQSISSPYTDGAGDLSRIVDPLLKNLGAQVDAKTTQAGVFSDKMQRAWSLLQEPIKIEDGVWLLIAPEDAWTTPILVRGQSLAFSLGVKALPRIVYEKPTSAGPKPLPSWKEKQSNGGTFNISLQSKLAFSQAEQLLKQQLLQVKLPTRLGRVSVEDVSFTALNSSVLVGVKVKSPLYRGWVYLTGELEYEPISELFVTRNLRVNVQSPNPLVRGLAWFFRGTFEQEVENFATWDGHGATQNLMQIAEKRFSEVSKGTLGLSIFGIEPVVDEQTGHQFIFTSEDAIHLAVTASGKMFYQSAAGLLVK